MNCTIKEKITVLMKNNTAAHFDESMLVRELKEMSNNSSYLTHKAHLRLSWELLNLYELKETIKVTKQLLEKYFSTTIQNNTYNKNLLVAYTEIVGYFKGKSSSFSFEKFLSEFPRLKFDFKKLVTTHYGYDILSSSEKEDSKKTPLSPSSLN